MAQPANVSSKIMKMKFMQNVSVATVKPVDPEMRHQELEICASNASMDIQGSRKSSTSGAGMMFDSSSDESEPFQNFVL